MLRSVNRVLLALCGLVLIVLGGSVLAVGLGAHPPSWWIHDGKRDVLLSRADRTRWRPDDWWWPVVIAALAVILLLALWWLAAELRRRRLTEVVIDTGDGEGAVLRGRALEKAFATEAGAIDGVGGSRVRLDGRRSAPEARVRLALEGHASPLETLHRTATEALSRARSSAGLDRLPTEVRLHAVKHGAERVN
ncbi:alkaline shock response membrane anchor protein AmaP [Streptomyces tsukubensis]|uniref:Alkaline shock response membrane anchor protein AmaP n=1 Tax=Streptomyces tsukubensis TaxID=83656 RepID=A0A1V4A3J1_9ACTN|nr:alkaline shock response membrane anchor protein AmaP [Streptomyces tsukubensis]OON74014.1 hypothetical protein B1H18_26240 [Streptomyces tsukubensis]QFR92939.1 alkaline shock response membrane anchor protein AmaP [Streptomyces tsukubensis]